MIEVRRLDKGLDYTKYDHIYMIVNSMKNTNSYITQMSALAPPSGLFKLHRKLLKEGNWNKNTFNNIYVPEFLKYLNNSKAALICLDKLWLQDKYGQNICLLCYCTNEELCHRSIVAGILQGIGCNVQLPSGRDYSHYYKQYRAMQI